MTRRPAPKAAAATFRRSGADTNRWTAKCLFKLFGGEHCATAAAALARANLVARDQIDDLPSFECSTFGLDMVFFQREIAGRRLTRPATSP